MITCKCHECGLINDLSDEVCQRCGAELREVASASSPSVSGYKSQDNRDPKYALEGFEINGEEFQPQFHIGPFSDAGAVVRPTISLIKNNLWLITKIIVVVFAPFEIFRTLSVGTEQQGWQFLSGVFFLNLLCKALVAPSLMYALMTVMQTGAAPGLNETYRAGLGRLGKVVICAFLAWILEALGFVFLIIPGIIVGLSLVLVYPMASLENRTPVEILKRSYNLTKGHRGNIFLASLGIGLLSLVVTVPALFVSWYLFAHKVMFWPLQALLGLIGDIVSGSTTILSLVIYLSIVNHITADNIVPPMTAPAYSPLE